MTSTRRLAGPIVLLMLLGAGRADAKPIDTSDRAWSTGQQQPPPLVRGRRGRAVGAEGLTVPALERYFDDYELLQLQRALGLDDEQFLVVGQRLRRVQNVRRRHQHEHRRLMSALRATLAGTAVDETEVGAALQALTVAGRRQAQERRLAQQGLDSELTVSQRARYRLFQERFERQKLDLLSRARQGRGGGTPPSNPPDPG